MKKIFILLILSALFLGANAQDTRSYWELNGNSGTTFSHFIGTTDWNPLIFKTNNTERMRLTENGFLGIGTATPAFPLHLHVVQKSGAKRTELMKFSFFNTDMNQYADLFKIECNSMKDLFLTYQGDANLSIQGYSSSLTFTPNDDVVVSTSDKGQFKVIANGTLITHGATITDILRTDDFFARSASIVNTVSAKDLIVYNAKITTTLTANTLSAQSATLTGAFNAQSADITTTLTANNLSAQSANITSTITTQNAQINGLLCAKEVHVKSAPCWPDFVFAKDYKLLPLQELEQYIEENQHLPNVPSAAEVEENGIELGEMNALLLQKVEELTRYIIDLQNQIDQLKTK